MQQKSPKSTLLADNTRELITTKQRKPWPVALAAPHPITWGGGGKRQPDQPVDTSSPPIWKIWDLKRSLSSAAKSKSR